MEIKNKMTEETTYTCLKCKYEGKEEEFLTVSDETRSKGGSLYICPRCAYETKENRK